MALEQWQVDFVRDLGETGLAWSLSAHGQMRAEHDGVVYCPVSAVLLKKHQIKMSMVQALFFGEALGLTTEQRCIIGRAADNFLFFIGYDTDIHAELRSAMLGAVDFTEQDHVDKT